VETFDWTVWSRVAAAENVPVSATATSDASCRRSITLDDASYRRNLLDRWR
jgi:hypothetical protein